MVDPYFNHMIEYMREAFIALKLVLNRFLGDNKDSDFKIMLTGYFEKLGCFHQTKDLLSEQSTRLFGEIRCCQ